MKIGILTASRTDNNGTDLQAMAMQKLFLRLGATDVEIIDYVCDKIDTKKPIRIILRNLFYLPIILYIKYSHRKFRNKYFNKSSQTYNKSNINTIPYDIVVVGSDQIWNLDITGGDTSFFLPFVREGLYKYSYAASLGTAHVDKWNNLYNIKHLLNDFQHVSVRESSAIDILKGIGVNANCDLDPILMGKRGDWKEFIKPSNDDKYLLLYLVGFDPQAIEYAQYIAKQKGLRIIMLNSGLRQWKGVEQRYFVSVEEWLNLMANADLIITNSYHGLSFAILFQRDFRLCLLSHSTNNNARMIDLVEKLHLSDYILNYQCTNYKPIDWNRVEDSLNSLVLVSEQYVKSIINNRVCH